MGKNIQFVVYSLSKGGASVGSQRLKGIIDDRIQNLYIQDISCVGVLYGKFVAVISILLFQSKYVKSSYIPMFFSYLKTINKPNTNTVRVINWVGNGFLSFGDYRSLDSNTLVFLHDELFYEGVLHYRLENVSRTLLRINNFIRNYKHNLIIKNKPVLIVPSLWLKERILLQYPYFSELQIHVLNIPIDTAVFRPHAFKCITEMKRVGISIGCKKYGFTKGIDIVEELLSDADIGAKFTDKLKFIFFGGASDPKSVKWPLTSYENFGYIDGDVPMSNFLNNLDYILIPSRIETFGQLAFEAMACGVVPIVYSTGAHSDYIVDEYNGLILSNISIRSIMEKLQMISEMNSEDYYKMSKNASALVKDVLSVTKCRAQFLKILDSK